MRSAEADDDDDAGCCAALFDVDAAGSAAAAAALARLPQRKGSYAEAAYWRSRYSAELAAAGDAVASYEWYDVSFEAFLAACASRLGCFRAGSVLQVGCGTSAWGTRLAALGLAVLDSDVDAALLARLRQAGSSCLDFAALDATRLALRPCCVDVVLDKGTVDALASAPDGPRRIAAVAAAALEVLRPGGVLLVVSARPLERLAAMRAACDDERTAAALAAAEVLELNATGAGVLLVVRTL